jgi:MSHA biogenesis protein MshQ
MLLLLLSNQLFAAQCSAVFPDVIATHGNGNGNSQINFGYNAHLINNPDTELSTRQVSHNSGSNINSCDSDDCTASNSSAESVSVNFQRGGGSVNYSPPSFQTTTFGIQGSNNYKNITARANATMQFGDAYNVYYFENLSLGFRNTLNLSAGKTYYFRKFSVGSSVSINVIGSGTATVFVDSKVDFISPSMINSPSQNRSGDVSKLVMHVKGNVTFGSRSTFSGALYAKNINFTSASYLFGVASGEKVTLGSNSVLTYDSTVFDADFGEICDFSSPATAVVNYQFDECKYTGIGNEVIDQLENFNAGASSGVSSSSSSVVNRSLDLSATGTGDWVTIPNDAIDGLNDFSISVWINTSVSKRQQEIFQALGSSASDDEVELYLINSSTLNIKLKDRDKNFSIGRSVTNGQWHHLVVTRVQDDICLYVNGSIQDCDDGFPNRELSVPNSNAVVLGQEQDSFGGGFNSGQSFEGKIDEFIIFDGALTADEITTIYDNQNSGKNYDGSSRDAVSCISVMANFQFDECAYTGVGNEVIDQLGSYSGTSFNNVNITDFGQIENALNMVSAPHHVQVNIPLPTTYSVSTWFKKPNSNSGSRYFVFGAMENGGDLLLLDRTRSMRWAVYQPDQGNVYGTYSFATLDANWHHMVLVYQGNTTSLYIDGNFIETVNLAPTGTLKYIGTSFDDVNGLNPQGFRSPLDEFIVFNGALSANDITEIYDYQNLSKNYDGSIRQASACKQIHHYEIVHDGNGLTCAAEPITIKACTDSSCSSLSTESVSLDFTVDSITKAPVTFTGSTDFNNPSFSFNHTTAETLTLSIAGATVSATNPLQCTGGSCDMRFSDSEFRFLYGVNNDSAIASQISGVDFSGLKIQARKNENGECKGLFSGLKNIELWQENLPTDPSDTNAGLEFEIGGNDIGKNPASAHSIALNFTTDTTGAESIATIPTSAYLDAGKIRLRASYNKDDISLVGNSNEFWVRPDRFEIDSTAKYNLITDSTFTAGKTFDFNVSALNYHGAETQNYRQTDGKLELKLLRVLPTNTASVNGVFTAASNIDLSDDLTNTFTEQTLTSFKLGTKKGISEFSGAKYNEVGSITVDVQDVEYGGLNHNGWVIPAAEVTLGRFIPAYFEQTLNTSGNLDSYHSAISRCTALNWAYTGQKVLDTESKGSIHYSLSPPAIDITAYNAGKQPTKNYTLAEDEDSKKILMKLSNTGVTITSPVFDQEQLQVGGVIKEDKSENVAIISNMERGTLKAKSGAAGTMTYTFSELDRFSYVRNHLSFLKPFEAEIPFITEAVLDGDGVTLRVDNTPLDSTDNPTEDFTIKGINIRFARMVVDNAYGPESSTLKAPIHIEIFNGTDSAYANFSKAADESCLTPIIKGKKPGNKDSGNMTLWDYRLIDIDNTDGLEVGNTSASITGVFDAGSHDNLFFATPNKQGILEFEYEVPDWLKFDWKNEDNANNGPHDVNPSATLNFGLYRGNDRIISWREVSQ